MFFLNVLDRVIRRPLPARHGRHSPVRRRPRPLTLEVLEDRTLLSVNQAWANASAAIFSGGALAIWEDAGDHTVRQAFTQAGFLDVTIDAREHSSDPASTFFDRALAGATSGTLTSIRFDGAGGQDTLILGAQALTGSLTVSASGANIIVDGAVHGGAITLAGSGWVTIEAGGSLVATWIDVSARVFVNSGQVRADGLAGGEVFISAGNVLNAGRISADGTAGGGLVQIAFTGACEDTSAAVTSADGGTGPGGSVMLDGGAAGHLFSSGRHEATGAIGGAVELFGQDIELVAATLDASGPAGGGVVRIGGDFHGGTVGHVFNVPAGARHVENVPHSNAQTVFVTAGTTMHADALARGNGGRVAVWADGDTTFGGTVTARGGPAGGDGGFIEVSGAGNLDYGGTADTSAPTGKPGTLLLDPKNLVIDEDTVLLPQFSFVDPHPTPAADFGRSVTVLSNGNVIVTNPSDNFGARNAGAVYVFNGLTGALVSSLVGSNASDYVGGGFYLGDGGVTALSSGNYVVQSPYWNGTRGAATWGSGTAGVSGVVSAANSLVGSNANDYVGGSFNEGGGGVTALSNGNYVVGSPSWNGGMGAATWGSGTAGVSGAVSAANSLVGSSAGHQVGGRITALTNGNYVVGSPSWNGSRGAATWGSGTTGVSGAVSVANSLVGSSDGDRVGASVSALTNGNYVVLSPLWNGHVGAATWGSGTAGVSGVVSAANSLVGSSANDQVGYGGVAALTNGNYVVQSPSWNGNLGAATWGSGTAGVNGAVSAANSLVGSSAGDLFAFGVTALTNGNYVVRSYHWNGNRGAATWGSGTAGITGVVSPANSLIGANPGLNCFDNPPFGDCVGAGVTALTNGNYVVVSSFWNGRRGAATWASGTSGQTLDGSGSVSPQNSLVGLTANSGLGTVADDPSHQAFIAAFTGEAGSGRVRSGFVDANQLTFARGQAQTLTITPALLTRTLNSGGAVILQASNDITINSAITVSAGGSGGALTLQAGRGILINASISTDNGALTLIANDTLADGVVNSQRDPGNAFITMAGGTVLDTGTGPLTIDLRDGAGLTSNSSRAINLQTITAGSVTILNNGPSAGSDIRLETVITNGPQSYSNPHGTATVAGYLLAGGSPITFSDSVTVNAGVTVGIDGDTVDFAGSGTQTLQSAGGSQFSNFTHTGSGTLRLTGGLNVIGSFLDAAGTFDANDQIVTVSGLAQITDGAYLAGTAPQYFHGGLVLRGGIFTSSTGPMTVTGPIAVLGGVLSGQGTIESVTDIGGTLAPSPGILSVAGSVTLFAATTFSATLNGTDPGSYSQVIASGPVILGGSTLDLSLGFTPLVGDAFTLLSSAFGPIHGTFAGLDEGATFMQGGILFQITYQGGPDGNSVVLTRVG